MTALYALPFLILALFFVILSINHHQRHDIDDPRGPMGPGHAETSPWEIAECPTQLEINRAKYRVPGWDTMTPDELWPKIKDELSLDVYREYLD